MPIIMPHSVAVLKIELGYIHTQEHTYVCIYIYIYIVRF